MILLLVGYVFDKTPAVSRSAIVQQNSNQALQHNFTWKFHKMEEMILTNNCYYKVGGGQRQINIWVKIKQIGHSF